MCVQYTTPHDTHTFLYGAAGCFCDDRIHGPLPHAPHPSGVVTDSETSEISGATDDLHDYYNGDHDSEFDEAREEEPQSDPDWAEPEPATP
jgi:hypothetical protein